MTMNKLRVVLFAVGATVASAVPVMVAGCAGTDAYITDEDPPPLQDEVVVSRPGYVFIHGHWGREGGRWNWHHGDYVRERPGYTYEEGRWQRNGNHRVWVEGRWKRG